MKKEQNAEKTKVRKLARTKEKVSQWTTNPLNEKVLDYHNYEMTKSESVLYFVAAFLVGGADTADVYQQFGGLCNSGIARWQGIPSCAQPPAGRKTPGYAAAAVPRYVGIVDRFFGG